MYPRLLALLLIAGSLAAAATGASAPSEPPIVSAGAHGLSILVPGQPVSVAAEATAPGPARNRRRRRLRLPRRRLARPDRRALVERLFARQRHRRRPGRQRRPRRHALQRRGDRGERGRSRQGDRRRAQTQPAPSSSTSSSSGRPWPRRRTCVWRSRTGAIWSRWSRSPTRPSPTAPAMRAGRSTRSTSSSRPITEACPRAQRSSSPTRRRPSRVRWTRRPRRSLPRRRRSPIGRPAHRHDAEAAAEAAGGGAAPEQARAPSSGFRRRTSRRRSRRRATSSPSTAASSFTDTFGAARAGVVWHHGQDIFAPLGTPLLAVADGTIFSVGWNDLGGYRLWLRDRQGNQFYYAHLSAFSPLAVDGNEVKAGAVVGFVGNTGDAQTTPYHLHFEIHPVGLLPLGYDGVVNPMPYLLRLAAAGGRHLRRRPRLGAAGALERDRAEAGGDPARLDRHLQRQRPRSRLAGPRADRPGLPGRQRGSRCRLGARPRRRSTSSCSPAACTCSRPTPRR